MIATRCVSYMKRRLSKAQTIALHQIETLIEFWAIDHVELGDIRANSEDSPVARKIAHLGPKYVHPMTGDTWDGSGLQPGWLRRALTTEGYRVCDLVPLDRPPTPDA